MPPSIFNPNNPSILSDIHPSIFAGISINPLATLSIPPFTFSKNPPSVPIHPLIKSINTTIGSNILPPINLPI